MGNGTIQDRSPPDFLGAPRFKQESKRPFSDERPFRVLLSRTNLPAAKENSGLFRLESRKVRARVADDPLGIWRSEAHVSRWGKAFAESQKPDDQEKEK